MKQNLLYLLVCLLANIGLVFAQTSSPDCATEVAGVPTPPSSLTVSSSNPISGVAGIPAPTASSPNYGFIITDADHLVIGLSNDGSFDFSSLPSGEYGFTGIAYNNAELGTVQQLVCALPSATISSAFGISIGRADSIKAYLCDGTDVTLIKLFGLLDLLSDQPQNIDSVAVQLGEIVASPLVTICYAITTIPTYTITSTVGSGIETGLLTDVMVSPTLVDDRIAIKMNLSRPQNISFDLYDLNGRLISSETLDNAPASINHNFYINNGNAPHGLLLLHIRTEEGVYTTKLMKK